MNGNSVCLEVLGRYIAQIEQENTALRQQVDQLKQQLQAATKAEA